jgi:rubrerythrin
MKTYICEICGDAYIGEDRPSECPFCGASKNFIKDGTQARPFINQEIELSELSRKNLEETLRLELHANDVYLCMAGKTKTYEIKAMYKRIAKVELEHASIVCKLMKIPLPAANPELCSDDDIENFAATVKLEEDATAIYANFAKEATEQEIKIIFTALAQIEASHITLIKNYCF